MRMRRSWLAWISFFVGALLLWKHLSRVRNAQPRDSPFFNVLTVLAHNATTRAAQLYSSSLAGKSSVLSLHRALELQEIMDRAVGGGNLSLDAKGIHDLYRRDGFSACPATTLDRKKQVDDMCSLLRGKTILLLGDRVQYGFHHMLLEKYSFRGESGNTICPGAAFCNWHGICVHPSSVPPSKPFLHDDRKHSVPTDHSHMTILRFIETTTLFPSMNRHDSRYREPHISRHTGIRDIESIWMPSLRGADVVILSKAPIPAPAWSFEHFHSTNPGNSGFELLSPRTGDLELEFYHYFADLAPKNPRRRQRGRIKYTAEDIVDAALRGTLTHWLPASLSTLIAIRSDSALRSKLLVWRGEWLSHAQCHPGTEGPRLAYLNDILGFNTMADLRLSAIENPWVTFHNVQVLFQSLILHSLLPHAGIPYIFLDIHLAPSSSVSRGEGGRDRESQKKGASPIKGCFQPHPDRIDGCIETAFLDGMISVLKSMATLHP
ncbi:hypothetical protein BS47DRAFT_872265 [Hydnum rufescens UP504]|uniref:Uncharacterized protein n=1 Tax=Hydnum rufescens UP504 TaxID=1448309 RepID=A0A9P6AYQ3_9AGAM|nr:hypothetical protein BS47DRAFT_872265 [Hydnum rufescens UP504]